MLQQLQLSFTPRRSHTSRTASPPTLWRVPSYSVPGLARPTMRSDDALPLRSSSLERRSATTNYAEGVAAGAAAASDAAAAASWPPPTSATRP